MSVGAEPAVLVVQESPMHPQSVCAHLRQQFEQPSVLQVVNREQLRSLTTRPVYDDRYLVIFEDLRSFKSNLTFLKLDIMLPLVICSSKSMREDAVALCQEKSVPFKVYINAFKKEDAYLMIAELATEKVSRAFCDTLVRRVGLNPQRIVSAIMVLEQVGYKTSNITRYVDKNIYIDVMDVIESLLGICSSQAQIKRAALYVHMNRLWYNKYTRRRLLSELDTIAQLYQHFLDGTLTIYNVSEYSEEHRVSRHKILYVGNLLERKSLLDILALRQFISKASILEVALHLT